MSFREQYLQKRRDADGTIREIHDADMVIVPSGVGEPPSILTALSEQRRNLRGVRVAHVRENMGAASGPMPDEALRGRMAADVARL